MSKIKYTIEKKKLETKLDTIRWKIIRDIWYCIHCWKRSKILNAHHVFGRRKLSVRRDIDNGVCLCPSCHILSIDFSAHQTGTEFAEWIIEFRGRQWYDDLKFRAYQIKQWTIDELEKRLEELTLFYDKIKDEWKSKRK